MEEAFTGLSKEIWDGTWWASAVIRLEWYLTGAMMVGSDRGNSVKVPLSVDMHARRVLLRFLVLPFRCEGLLCVRFLVYCVFASMDLGSSSAASSEGPLASGVLEPGSVTTSAEVEVSLSSSDKTDVLETPEEEDPCLQLSPKSWGTGDFAQVCSVFLFGSNKTLIRLFSSNITVEDEKWFIRLAQPLSHKGQLPCCTQRLCLL
ncbi:hypothetical protein NE237_016771 [Protea cynaroides]|uniref:Uncharacterized protein n=1 Tax=Protea cynaroides TaxID=273540 RepID=A0A9Q0K6L0_9MAGN|nr:hypothetical protein NE237_016771 [Protea cynaroides]